jgi:hypothetical protein
VAREHAAVSATHRALWLAYWLGCAALLASAAAYYSTF